MEWEVVEITVAKEDIVENAVIGRQGGVDNRKDNGGAAWKKQRKKWGINK